MKTAIRRGVFETNSSSTHTLTLVPKKDYETDNMQEKPKYRKYAVISTKYDKLLMACGCCSELFEEEANINLYASWGYKSNIDHKNDCDEIKIAIENGMGDLVYIANWTASYEIASGLLIRVFCELTGEDYDTIYAKIAEINKNSGACHMEFFDNEALYDAGCDYRIIDNMFRGNLSEVLENIRNYFDDDTVLCYREYYGGVDWDKDDDD